MSSKSVLFITQIYPSGATGTTVKTRNTILFLLKKGFEIDVCCVHHEAMVKNEINAEGLRIFTVPKLVISKLDLGYILRVLSVIASPLPFRIKKMYDRRLDTLISILEQNSRYDYVFYDGFSTLQYAKNYSKKYIYIDDEDITDLLGKREKESKNILLKLFFRLEIVKCKWYERRFLPRVSQLWAISPNSLKRLKNITNAKSFLMPTVVPFKRSAFKKQSKDIVFSGLLSWMENVQGVKWFLENHWGQVLREVPDAKLIITGQMANDEFQNYLKKFKNVALKGYVGDLFEVYKKTAVAISPILINSGIKVKVLTYLSFGLPVVALTQSTWGMSSLKGVETANEHDFGVKVISLLKDNRKREKLAAAGISNIKQYHSEEALEIFFLKAEVI